ncbi:MAG: LysE family translocator [Emcibacteraceae bacterium]|nr:LysE family translocator [Emcibacteraceae bacterium]
MTILLAMALYAFSMSITPGPTNIVLLSTGANHGFLKAVPFATGSAIGFTVLNIIVGLGIGTLISKNGIFMTVVSYFGAAFIIYMGVKVATSSSEIKVADKNSKAPGFLLGFVGSWLNPKAWIAVVAGVSAFNLGRDYVELAIYVSIYVVVGYLSILTWAYAGSRIAYLLTCARNMRYFNLTMGGGLIIIALYLVSI